MKLLRNLQRALLNRDPSFCDMAEDPPCREIATEYLRHIRRHLREGFGDRRLAMLDAGCQAGRLLIPLAQEGHRMIGLDTSGFALRRAAQHAKPDRLPIRLQRGDIAHLRRWINPESLDAVVCTEVLYLCQDYHQLLQRLIEAVRPGGLLFVSHRPALYYVATAVRRGRPDQAASVARRSDGPSPDGEYHNWQTAEQLTVLYRGLGLALLGCYPIDLIHMPLELSTVADARVSAMLEPVREDGAQFQIPTYLLVVARKPVR